MAQLVGHDGCIIAIEPQPALSNYLEAGFAGTPQVHVIHGAASSENDTALLRIPLDKGVRATGGASLEQTFGDAEEVVQVTTIRLDSLSFSQPLRVIKIDVEGHEWSVLMGANALIERHRPVIFAELDWRMAAEHVADFVDHLVSHIGYVGHRYRGGVLRPLNSDRFRDPTINADGFNFVFIPTGTNTGSASDQ